jgi:small-conductance mechanosensitive channel
LSYVFKIFLIVTVPATLAVDTISLIDIFAFTALAIGLVLRCSLANITAVFSVILLKRFKISDLKEVQGHIGTVTETDTIHSTIVSPANELIAIPNGHDANNTATGQIKVDTIEGKDYSGDQQPA